MNIETTSFEHSHESSQIKYSLNQEYIYHNITVCNHIEFNGHSFQLTYQAGHEYIHGDYSSPSNKLSLYEAANVLLEKLDELCEKDFDDKTCKEYIDELLGEFNNFGIETKEDLLELYTSLNDNLGAAEQYRIHEIQLSADIEDYERSGFDEHGFKYIGGTL